MIYTSNSSDETKSIGKRIASTLNSGEVVLLYGGLGAGKTTLVKGMAEYFGIAEDRITSPTFTLMNIYFIKDKKNATSIAHIDTYRLENEKQLVEIGVEDYIGKESVICLVEWPEKVNSLVKNKKTRSITLNHMAGDKRKIIVN